MECSVCKKPTSQLCSRCLTKCYCSRSCQVKDYPNHKLVCSPRSADILVKNVFEDLIPTKIEVQYEYGFCNCLNPEEQSKLLGLYIGLVVYIGCSASQLHSWWESGELPLKIKKAYDDAGHHTAYYEWFIKNMHVLHGLRKYEGEKTDKLLADKYHAMVKPYLSEHDQGVTIKSLPESKREVCLFYVIMLIGCIPDIELQCWIDFGFCTCKFGKDHLGEDEEKRLGELYRELIIQKDCKVDEFHDAYVSGSVIDLLKRKCDNTSWLSESKIEFRGYNQPTKSVYYLKQYALRESVNLQPSVRVDYGFMNCRTKDEIGQLRQMYNKLIKTPQFDPRNLHEACLAGKIFDYVSSILPNEVLKADLLKNLYPLKDLE